MIDVIVPALDEAAAIGALLATMPPGVRPIVVDNGSTDETARRAAAGGAEVIHEPVRGFGSACHTGLCAARSEIVCFMDGDGSLDPAELERVVGPVAGGAVDLCLGARQAMPGVWPWHARSANRFLAWELRRRTGAALTDLGPMRAARREALLGLGLRDRAFGYPLEMVLRAADAGWRIAEVPVTYRARAGGRSKVSGSVRGTARAVRDMTGLLAGAGRGPAAAVSADEAG